MKTLLVPIDFTPTSNNAINFAVEWSRQYGYERIILLKTFYDSMFENVIMSAEYCNLNEDYLNKCRDDAKAELNELCHEVAQKAGKDVKIATALSEFPLLRSIVEVVQNESPELIILGSDSYSYSSESFVAANVITIAKVSPVKVLIVPANYQYQPVESALLPYNADTIKDLNKAESLRNSKPWTDLKLLALNVNTKTSPDERLAEVDETLKSLLKNYQHEVYHISNRNIISGIIDFTKEHDVQLIIALPGKHSFLYTFTHKSISEAIYRNARQPVLILK